MAFSDLTFRPELIAPSSDTVHENRGRLELKQALAGLSFREQVERVKPPLPLGAASAVQADNGGSAQAAGEVQRIAGIGVSGGGSPLPHLERLQAAFGGHDLSGVRAHVGGSAAKASSAMGAQAYAMGNQVAFKSAPDLRTAAHEAAHVVQQRAGVQLQDGVGRRGDRYEQSADAVADAVVQGKSAADLLGPASTDRGQAVQQCPAVQAMYGFELELGVVVERFHHTDFSTDPPRAVFGHPGAEIVLAKGDGFQVKRDHATPAWLGHTIPRQRRGRRRPARRGVQIVDNRAVDNVGISILELVTDPLDECAEDAPANLVRLIQNLLRFEEAARASIGQRSNLCGLGVNADAQLVAGGKAPGNQKTDAHMQATYALRLDKYTEAMRQHAELVEDQNPEGTLGAKTAIALRVAVGIANEVFARIERDLTASRFFGLVKGKSLEAQGLDQIDSDAVKGFLALLAGYVYFFNMPQNRFSRDAEGKLTRKIGKNTLGMFFSKSDLTDTRGLLHNKFQSYLKKNAGKLTNLVFTGVNPRGLHDANDKGKNPTTSIGTQKGWIRNILTGSSDQFIDWKNEYSAKIDPYKVGPDGEKTGAVVVENRHPELMLEGGDRVKRSDWGAAMWQVFELISKINAGVDPGPYS